MSRSYKKYPYYTDGKAKTTSLSKRFANKTVRKYKHKIANGKQYKHLFCSYNIHDFIIRWTWRQELEQQQYKNQYSNIKELYKRWDKCFRRK